MENIRNVRITLVRSPIATPARHRKTLTGLGLRRMHQSVERLATPALLGMVAQIGYMLKCEDVK